MVRNNNKELKDDLLKARGIDATKCNNNKELKVISEATYSARPPFSSNNNKELKAWIPSIAFISLGVLVITIKN